MLLARAREDEIALENIRDQLERIEQKRVVKEKVAPAAV
jgi:hypothetical protein